MPPPSSAWQEAEITGAIARTPSVRSILLRPRAPRPFRAGQHVDVRLTAPDGYQAWRSYSVASAPEAPDILEIAVEHLPDGEVSPYLHDVARPGDMVEVRGPLGGHFVWEAGDGGPVLLVGGGSGVAPLMSMVRHRAASGAGVPMLLLYGARGREEVIFRDELMRRDAEEDGLDVVLALSRGAPWRPGDHGRRIDAAVLEAALARLGAPPRVTFVCGGTRFVEAVAGDLVALGLPPGAIRTERFGGA